MTRVKGKMRAKPTPKLSSEHEKRHYDKNKGIYSLLNMKVASMFVTKTHHRAKEFYIYRSFQPKIDVKKGDGYTKVKEQITVKWPSLARLNSGCASPVDIELLAPGLLRVGRVYKMSCCVFRTSARDVI